MGDGADAALADSGASRPSAHTAGEVAPRAVMLLSVYPGLQTQLCGPAQASPLDSPPRHSDTLRAQT
ncbi:hypothetical protein EYF80_038267 [Liparis tanakae]|uniref:Uncharacterized protein n=1 Tax=Liparis tanakae TaxID=230148 RepID=A0A4Z2GD69_9TELE|nr:hypothetical protein EYF80_038267 [Liparis tanakae]